MEARDVFVSCVESSGASDLQRALVPAPFMRSINATVTGYVRITLDDSTAIICQTFPLLNSFCDEGFQVVACNCVCVRGNDNVAAKVKGNYRLTTVAVTPLKTVSAKEISVTVIMISVKDVLNYRKKITCIETSLRDLLKLYGIVNDCTINCYHNPLARLLGISQLIVGTSTPSSATTNDHKTTTTTTNTPITTTKSHPIEVSMVTEDTKIIINSMESEDRRRLTIQDRVSLGGLDRVLTYLRRIVSEPWERREEFEKAGVLYPSGVLMVGPPGCGKTSVVRQVCAETGASLVGTAAVEIVSPHHGQSERNFAKVAERARALSEEGPCIFFIDEIDSLCPARSAYSSHSALTLTTQVILEMDLCRACSNLTLMAATNRPFDLDLGIRRSGRLEVEILLNVPSAVDRASILQVHISDLLPPSHPALHQAAHTTPGFVGADIKALVQATHADLETGKEGQTIQDHDTIGRLLVAKAASITPSIHKTLDFITTRPVQGLAEVGGLEEVRRELDQIFQQHTKFAAAYETLKLRRPRGVLLYGPRGCGKTRLVASLATNRGCTFLSATASHLLSPYVGESEKRVAALFHAARQARPTILFIDEIDGIFGRREGSRNSTSVSLLNELLQAMDGADLGSGSLQGASLLSDTSTAIQDGVLVCAATNHPQRLDPALLRPGRLDRLVFIPLPDYQARLDILRVKTRRMEMESGSVLEDLAERTEGFTGAELEGMVLRATKTAIVNNQYDLETLVPHLQSRDLLPPTLPTPATTQQELQAYRDFQRSVGGFGARASASSR